MSPPLRPLLLSLLCGALLGAPAVARATVIYPPGESMGPDSTHHSLGPSLLLGMGQERLSAGFGLHYQVGALKQHPSFHAALTGEPAQRRYGLELGTSLHLGGERSSPWWLTNVTADAVLRLERGRLVPALAPGVSLAHVGLAGDRWVDMSVKLRAVLPPWHWASSGPPRGAGRLLPLRAASLALQQEHLGLTRGGLTHRRGAPMAAHSQASRQVFQASPAQSRADGDRRPVAGLEGSWMKRSTASRTIA